jgi:hypothetical protein
VTTLLRFNVGAFRATLGPHALGVAAVVAVAPVLFALCGLAAGARLPLWTAVLLAVPIFLVDRSSTLTPSWLWLALVVGWVWQVPGFSWWCLGAAAAGLLGHTATALLASIPSEARLPRPAMRRYAVRLAIVMGVTAGVAGGAAALRGHAVSGSTAYAVVAVLLSSALLWSLRHA